MGKLAKIEIYSYDCTICTQPASTALCSGKNCVFLWVICNPTVTVSLDELDESIFHYISEM